MNISSSVAWDKSLTLSGPCVLSCKGRVLAQVCQASLPALTFFDDMCWTA